LSDEWIDGLVDDGAAHLRFPTIHLSSDPTIHLICGLKQKPAAVSSRGFLLNLSSTSAGGVGNDDDQNDL